MLRSQQPRFRGNDVHPWMSATLTEFGGVARHSQLAQDPTNRRRGPKCAIHRSGCQSRAAVQPCQGCRVPGVLISAPRLRRLSVDTRL